MVEYEHFVARIDAHCERVEQDHAEQLECAPGCSSCCHRQLTVFAIEAERIRRWLDSQRGLAPYEPTDAAAAGHPALLLATDEEACALLDRAGRCRIYPVRPVICRTHGLPLAIEDDDGAVRGDVCPLNFSAGSGLSAVPSEDFLSLKTTNTVLATLNARFEAERGGEAAGLRVALADLAMEPLT
jgi:Fe-S-cluster containining protein